MSFFSYQIGKILQIDNNYRWQEFKRHLLLGRKVMTNLDSILKSRNITLLTNVHLVKAMFKNKTKQNKTKLWFFQ